MIILPKTGLLRRGLLSNIESESTQLAATIAQETFSDGRFKRLGHRLRLRLNNLLVDLLLNRRYSLTIERVFLVADATGIIHNLIRDVRLLTHLENVDPSRQYVAWLEVSEAGHRTLIALAIITEGLRRLKDFTSAIRVQIFIGNQMGAHQILTELAARVGYACTSISGSDLLGFSFSCQKRRAIVLLLSDVRRVHFITRCAFLISRVFHINRAKVVVRLDQGWDAGRLAARTWQRRSRRAFGCDGSLFATKGRRLGLHGRQRLIGNVTVRGLDGSCGPWHLEALVLWANLRHSGIHIVGCQRVLLAFPGYSAALHGP